jgi:hypothetical protein
VAVFVLKRRILSPIAAIRSGLLRGLWSACSLWEQATSLQAWLDGKRQNVQISWGQLDICCSWGRETSKHQNQSGKPLDHVSIHPTSPEEMECRELQACRDEVISLPHFIVRIRCTKGETHHRHLTSQWLSVMTQPHLVLQSRPAPTRGHTTRWQAGLRDVGTCRRQKRLQQEDTALVNVKYTDNGRKAQVLRAEEQHHNPSNGCHHMQASQHEGASTSQRRHCLQNEQVEKSAQVRQGPGQRQRFPASDTQEQGRQSHKYARVLQHLSRVMAGTSHH